MDRYPIRHRRMGFKAAFHHSKDYLCRINALKNEKGILGRKR